MKHFTVKNEQQGSLKQHYLERSFEGFLLRAVSILVAAAFVRHVQLTCETEAE